MGAVQNCYRICTHIHMHISVFPTDAGSVLQSPNRWGFVKPPYRGGFVKPLGALRSFEKTPNIGDAPGASYTDIYTYMLILVPFPTNMGAFMNTIEVALQSPLYTEGTSQRL